MRRQGVQLRTTPIIHEVASLAIINVLRDAYPGLAYASMTASTYKESGLVGGRRGVTFLRRKLTEKLAFRGIIARNLDEH